jgi:hypothetical protein
MRYFRATAAVYDSICAQLDSAYGYPNEATKTARTLPLRSQLPSDNQSLVYLSIPADYCDYNLPSEMLPQLLASGEVEEITEDVYRSALPESPSPVS